MRISLLLLFLFTSHALSSQSATIRIKQVNFPEQFRNFGEIIFIFNNQQFSGSDTSEKKIALSKEFDNCCAIVGKDTIRFLTKFRNGESYSIFPGSCCCYFFLRADHDPRLGVVRFENPSNKMICSMFAMTEIDTLQAKSTGPYSYGFESANCLYKTTGLNFTKTEFNNVKYTTAYSNEKTNMDSLWKFQKREIMASTSFQFLHGEKITAIYNAKDGSITLRLDGYLSDEEFNILQK